MALVSLSSKCFNAGETALEAVKTGDAHGSAVILRTIKQDGLLLQQEASVLCDRLGEAEEYHKQKVEDLTRQMNELHEKERQLENEKEALETKKSSLADERERSSRSREEASRRYEAAQNEKRQAEFKYEELKRWFWVPIVGTALAVRELIENNEKKASDAHKEMKRFDRDIDRAASEIRWANSAISQVRESQCLHGLLVMMCSPTLNVFFHYIHCI